MAAMRYKLLFKGGVRQGFAASQVQQQLGDLLKIDSGALEQLFSGRLITLKRDLSQDDAYRYQRVLESLGAEVLLQQQEAVAMATEQKNVAPANDSAVEESVAARSSTNQTLQCPRCGHSQTPSEHCGHCKMDLRRHMLRLERKAKAQQLRAEDSQARAAVG